MYQPNGENMETSKNKQGAIIRQAHDGRAPTKGRNMVLPLLLATFLIYFNSLPNDFIFDDVPLVQNSLNVMNMGFLDLVTSYRPLRYLSYALDYRIFGMNPWGFRLMNIVYHSLTVISLFWMLKVFGLSKRAAFISSLIFAIHPANTDSVAYISGRRDVIMGLFYVLSVGWFMKFYNGVAAVNRETVNREQMGSETVNRETVNRETVNREEKKPRITHHASRITHHALPLLLSFLFLFLSISSKEMGATIPLIFVLYIIYKDGSKLFEKKWFYPAAMSLLLLFSFFVFYAISSGGSGLASLSGFQFHGNSPKIHYLTASTIWLHYLKMTIFPLKLILDNANYPLVLDWNFHLFFSVQSMFIYGWVVFDLTLNPSPEGEGLENTPRSFRKGDGGKVDKGSGERSHHSPVTRHALAFFLVFFVITLAPVLQIIPLHEIVALHYLYVPVIGFCAVVGIIVDLTQTSPQTPLLKERGLKLPLPLGKGSGERLNPSTITPFHGRTQWFAPTIILIIILSLFSIRTVTRNFELKDIWTAIHADEKWMPLSFRGYFTIGAQYVEMKFPDKAGEYYQKALETGAWDGNLLGNIIGYHILKGDHTTAINFYEEMVRKNEFITSAGTLNMAVLYMLSGNCKKAVQLATSFSPLSNQVKRIELIKKCDTYSFDKFDDNEIEDIYHKQELMKELGLEIERKPYLMQLVDLTLNPSQTSPQTPLLKERGLKPPLPLGKGLGERSGELESPFTTHEILDLIRELAVVNLQSDVPEAIKYYKLERELLIKLGKPVPEIVEKSIAVLEDYQYKVLVEGKYYKLEW